MSTTQTAPHLQFNPVSIINGSSNFCQALEDSTYLVWIDNSLAMSPEDFVATGTIMRINQHRKRWSTSVIQQLMEDFKKRKLKKKKVGQTKIVLFQIQEHFFSRVQVISSQCGHLKKDKQCAPYRCLLLCTNYKRRVRSLAKIQTPILQMSCIRVRWIPPKNLTG